MHPLRYFRQRRTRSRIKGETEDKPSPSETRGYTFPKGRDTREEVPFDHSCGVREWRSSSNRNISRLEDRTLCFTMRKIRMYDVSFFRLSKIITRNYKGKSFSPTTTQFKKQNFPEKSFYVLNY